MYDLTLLCMTSFQTPVQADPLPWLTGYRHKNLFIGSCFTVNIGEQMEKLCYPVDINPFGILYNPAAIAGCLNRLTEGTPFSEKDIFTHNGLCHSYLHHGSFSGETPDETLQKINQRLAHSSTFVREAGFLFLTLGTAWVYELRASGNIVANCHKVPADQFRRFRLSLHETVDILRTALENVWSVNPGLKVIFTVSPIRHMKDGAAENQLSKSTLILAADALIRGYGSERCAYFPAYEIVMDELRDYRFYAEDMIHLSPVAISHIREKFEETVINRESRETARKISKVINALEHRPIRKNTPEYYNFLVKTLTETDDLYRNNSYLQLDSLRERIMEKINDIRHSI